MANIQYQDRLGFARNGRWTTCDACGLRGVIALNGPTFFTPTHHKADCPRCKALTDWTAD